MPFLISDKHGRNNKKYWVNSEVSEICQTPSTPVHAAEKRVVLLIAILAGFITPFDGSAVNIALPTIGAEFHMNAIALSWVANRLSPIFSSVSCSFWKNCGYIRKKKSFPLRNCDFQPCVSDNDHGPFN